MMTYSSGVTLVVRRRLTLAVGGVVLGLADPLVSLRVE
jgi:hypothetical protein